MIKESSIQKAPLPTLAVIVFGAVLVACASQSRVSTAAGSITEIVIPAPALEGNLLGDPTVQRLSIYLPPGYNEAPEKRYPVLYLLHGFTGTNRTWLIDPTNPANAPAAHPRDGGYQRAGFLKQTELDAIFQAGSVPEMIIVAPNGRNAYKHSFYVNSPVTGNWEDYVVEDVVGYIDTNYRTISTAPGRGIAGHSGGGNGALFLAMRHSDIFGSVYAMAACCSGKLFSLPPLENTETGRPDPFWQEVYERVHSLMTPEQSTNTFTKRNQDFYVVEELAASAAFTPNPDRAPLYADYLFEFQNELLTLDRNVLDRRLEHSVYRLVDQHEDDLRALRGIFIEYGEYEMDALARGNLEFADALGERSIPFILEVYAGGDHGNMVAERLKSQGFAFFAKTLVFSEE